MVLTKLALSNFVVRKMRVALTVAAIALSVSLVVSVTSGYASAESAAFKFLSQYMGSHDAQISRTGDLRGGVNQNLCDALLADADVKAVTPRLEMESGLLDPAGKPISGRPANIIGISRPDDKRVESMQMQEGGWFDSSTGDVAVIDQAAARIIKTSEPKNNDENAPALHVGDTFDLPGPNRKLTLKIVGIVHKPAIVASVLPSIYVPLQTLQDFTTPDQPRQVTRVMVDLKDGANGQAFSDRWKAKLSAEYPMTRLRLTSESKGQLSEMLQGIRILSYMGGLISMLAATFIVFSSLSMGVAERQRTLAMLRAIGAFRFQLGVLVVIEGLVLAAVGVVVGVPLGMLWTKLIVWGFPEMFAAGMTLSRGGVLLATIGSLGAAVGASFLPAWSAMRISPLEAMSPMAGLPTMRAPILCALAGLVLVSFDPILVFAPIREWAAAMGAHDPLAVARQITFYGHFVLGLPGIMIGYFLLAPMFVWCVEKVAAPFVAMIFGINYTVLRQQLSGGIWCAAGTCAALMVGLAILIVLQTQGHTMLEGWTLPTHFPDIFIVSYKIGGMNPQEQEKLKTDPGIRNGEIMPIAIASPEFGGNFFSIAGAAVMPDATMFFGVNPDQAMQMMELKFLQGNPKDATEQLKKGRHLIVTQEFHEIKGLNIGDKIPLKTLAGTVDYTIAAVVWSPGIDVFVNSADMGRLFEQRTAASVFGTLEDARKDFGITGVYLFAANLDFFVDKEKILQQVKEAVGGFGMRAGDVRHIKAMIQKGFEQLLLLVSTVAFCSMAVASLGVTNTIMASIRSRRWQFGILRSIGVTRGGLLRLVLAEALLLGIVGCGLGLTAGLEMSLDANELSRIVLGYNPRVYIPWGIILIGTVVVLLIALVASVLPAIGVARTEPLDLLQAGRASM